MKWNEIKSAVRQPIQFAWKFSISFRDYSIVENQQYFHQQKFRPTEENLKSGKMDPRRYMPVCLGQI